MSERLIRRDGRTYGWAPIAAATTENVKNSPCCLFVLFFFESFIYFVVLQCHKSIRPGNQARLVAYRRRSELAHIQNIPFAAASSSFIGGLPGNGRPPHQMPPPLPQFPVGDRGGNIAASRAEVRVKSERGADCQYRMNGVALNQVNIE